MERMTAGTRQGHGSTQASASLFHAISSGIFRSLEWRFSKTAVVFFKVCKNSSGIFQSLEIAMAFL